MAQVTKDNNSYCRSYIIGELQKNVNLFVETKFNNAKYFITTRPIYKSYNYYIVLSLLQENSETSDVDLLNI